MSGSSVSGQERAQKDQHTGAGELAGGSLDLGSWAIGNLVVGNALYLVANRRAAGLLFAISLHHLRSK